MKEWFNRTFFADEPLGDKILSILIGIFAILFVCGWAILILWFILHSIFDFIKWTSRKGGNTNYEFEDKSPPFLQITTPYQRFTASAKALHFSILQLCLLRWQLYRAGVLPLRLVHFLHEMTARHLLETDGATWRFRHRILQAYFAGQWEKRNVSEGQEH